MNVVDYILEGLEAELALERELGVRLVDFDRGLLTPNSQLPTPNSPPSLSFAFLYDKALSPSELEMMGKIVAALGKTPSTAPVVFDGPRPAAKAYIVLGSVALKKWFPGLTSTYGSWLSAPDAPQILYTYAPSYILRFATVTPAVQKIKKDMWQSIKSVLEKVRQ